MKDDDVFLKHVLDSINQIEEYVDGMGFEDFVSNKLVQDGVVRQLEIIGEATKHLSSAITVLRTCQESSPFYLHYFLAWNKAFLNYLGENSTGTMYPTVKEDFILTYDVPFAPVPEQCRIVTKIEELFTRLDAGVSELKKMQAQLKRYRQSILKSACEGKLVPTEAELAKAEGRTYEPAGVLLARKLKRRREKWKGKGKYKEPVAPDTSGLPEMPEGWVWATIEQLAASELYAITDGPFGSNLKTSHCIMIHYTSIVCKQATWL